MRSLELDQVLALTPHIRAEVLDAQSVFLIGERQRFVLADPRVATIAALIDGKRAVHDILADAGPEISEAQTLYVLDHLCARGYLVDAAPDLPPDSTAFWHGIGLDARKVTDRLARVPVCVRSIGGADLARWMGQALEQTGIRLDAQASTQVVVTDDYLRPELATINAEARAQGASWFIVQPVGTQPLIGPLFQPGDGPCWECLAFWLRNNRPVEAMVRRRTGGTWVPLPRAVVESSARTAANIAALSLARTLASDPAVDRRPLLALDLISLQTSRHPVIRRPQCPVCGDPRRTAARAEEPIALAAVPKRHCSDGGYRQAPPEETWERYSHLVSPISGPVCYVEPVPERTNELRTVYASGYLSCPRTELPRGNTFDKKCAGKGRSTIQAKTSALCEALERFSGVWQGDEARIRATAAELGPLAVLPSMLTNFSEAQERAATAVRGDMDRRHRIPQYLEANAAIDWAPAPALGRGERRYVPLAYCYAEAPAETGTAFCDPCGNGVAAGTCLEEAILQGLLELVERDAVGIWWYNRITRPGVDLDSFGDAYFNALCADYAGRGWRLWALDLTHDLGIPTFAALAHHAGQDRFAIGFGSHLDARLAVQRALTEVNQLFDPAARRRAPWDIDRLADRAYLFPDPQSPPVPASHFLPLGGADLRADIACCLDRLHRANLEAMVVDKTRPDIGLPVVQVIVPGLRHFWPRFGPGRLYDVPRALGWVAAAAREEDLNQVPLLV